MIIPKDESIDIRADVRFALGANSDAATVLCTHDSINMWSRMKPVRIANAFPDRSGRWWRGDAGNCGIDTSHANCPSWIQVPGLYTSDRANGYSYQRVHGGESQPCRIADFRGYDSEAKPPVLDFSVTARVAKAGAAILKASYAPYSPDYDLDSPGSLTFDEIGGFQCNGHSANLGDLYFGVVITDGSVPKKYISQTRNGMTEISVNVADLQIGTYKVYPFFSEVKQDGKLEMSGTYFSLPNVVAREFELVETNVNIEINAAWHNKPGTYDKDYLTYEIYVTQNVGSGYYLANNHVSVRFARNPDNAPFEPYEYTRKIDNVNVLAGGRYLIASGQFDGPFSSEELYNLRVSLHGGAYNNTIYPLEDFQPIH